MPDGKLLPNHRLRSGGGVSALDFGVQKLCASTPLGEKDAMTKLSPARCATILEDRMIAATLFVKPEDLQRIRASLAADGVEVIPTADLEEAIQTPAPVLLLDGDSHPAWDQALRHVVEMHPTAKIVVLSRKADHRMWVEVLSQGAHDLLCKPLLASEVRQAVLGALRIATGTESGAAAA
jgi:hypothetical protein